MKIPGKLKAFLQIGGGQEGPYNDEKSLKLKKKNKKNKSKDKMSYKRNGVTSKSMLDLRRTKFDDQQQQQHSQNLRMSNSYWNVEGGREPRKKPPAPEPPPVPSRRLGSLPSLNLEGNDYSRPKKVSTVQFAEGMQRNSIQEEDEIVDGPDEEFSSSISRDQRSSTGSSTSASTPITPTRPSSSSLDMVSGSKAFVSDRNSSLPQAQSMMQLSRPYKGSNYSDDEHKSIFKKPSSALHALKNLSRSTPAMSPSASPRHSDSEGPPRVSKGTKKFMRHFADAPTTEWVLNYFSCALVSDILLQGTLYITPNYFAFYSKIFGHVSRLLIPIAEVAGIQKERTAKIIPNAVGLQTVDGKSYVFGSLLSRDSTYKLMNHMWKKTQLIQDSDSEPPSGVRGAVEDDCDDSVSGSGDSFADEDQPDQGNFLPAASSITALTGVANTTGPWVPRDTDKATTAPIAVSASTILTSPNLAASSTNTTTSTNNKGGALPNLSEVPNAAVATRRGSSTATKTSSSENPGGGGAGSLLEWFTQANLVKTCFKMGSIPLKLIGDGMKEIWALPRTSLLLLISTLLLLMLFASAAFMLHRVDVLSQQLGLEKYDEYDGMYEEVLQMQQRLHAAASSEIEKTLSIQLKHIATVRQSLEALVVLFNKEPPVNAARIPDNT